MRGYLGWVDWRVGLHATQKTGGRQNQKLNGLIKCYSWLPYKADVFVSLVRHSLRMAPKTWRGQSTAAEIAPIPAKRKKYILIHDVAWSVSHNFSFQRYKHLFWSPVMFGHFCSGFLTWEVFKGRKQSLFVAELTIFTLHIMHLVNSGLIQQRNGNKRGVNMD